ncbi:hypothetical protein [Bradyrhizobium sp. CCGB01]|uniref:hypothetical protein n=1 Tax=Bradyrhizobium sp. CCGB01 TaxID=2949634 RepID=UPI0020B28000|nr:hypothetical protein [Bradyrhizobium sp. CCGB01]MCP3405599.1 hypothetical protein [Bradyrhizobium sp. CCGB01]
MQTPTKYELVVNLKAAKAFGRDLPATEASTTSASSAARRDRFRWSAQIEAFVSQPAVRPHDVVDAMTDLPRRRKRRRARKVALMDVE